MPHVDQAASQFAVGNAKLCGGAREEIAFFHTRDGKPATLTGVRNRVSEEFTFCRVDKSVRRERGSECRQGPSGRKDDSAADDVVAQLEQVFCDCAQGLPCQQLRSLSAAT